MRSSCAALGLLALVGACAPRGHQQARGSAGDVDAVPCAEVATEAAPPTNEPADPKPDASSADGDSPAPSSATPASATPSARLPAGVLPGVATEVPVPGDSSVRVVNGGPSARRALVYLHGMCGNPEAMADWSPVASHYGTLIVLRADVPCGNRPGFKWPQDVRVIQQRIDRALEAVEEHRDGLLDGSQLVLVGYSQGAHRAERLAEAYPERYPHLILGGPPGAASPERLGRARAVAILGGEREDTAHMLAGATALHDAGLRSRFFQLPGVGHGGYGPEAPQVLGEVFAWLLD